MSFRLVPNSVTLDDLERRNSHNRSPVSPPGGCHPGGTAPGDTLGPPDRRTDRPPFLPSVATGYYFCLESDVDRVEFIRLTLRFFDDVSTAS